MKKAPNSLDEDDREVIGRLVILSLFILLFFATIWWLAGVISIVGYSLEFWPSPIWLSGIAPHIPTAKISLGEVGDTLTGTLQPVALAWFVFAVLLQSRELHLQRLEFKKLTQEYRRNKDVADRQAQHLGLVNTIAERELVRSLVKDSMPMVRVNANKSHVALRNLGHGEQVI